MPGDEALHRWCLRLSAGDAELPIGVGGIASSARDKSPHVSCSAAAVSLRSRLPSAIESASVWHEF